MFEKLAVIASIIWLPLVVEISTAFRIGPINDEWDGGKSLTAPVDKRMLGIFQCSGWGPGCSQLRVSTARSRDEFEEKDASRSVPEAPEDILDDLVEMEDDQSTANIAGTTARLSSEPVAKPVDTSHLGSAGRQNHQPFFTLTSGGSWGPTGKRSGWYPRRYAGTGNDKRVIPRRLFYATNQNQPLLLGFLSHLTRPSPRFQYLNNLVNNYGLSFKKHDM